MSGASVVAALATLVILTAAAIAYRTASAEPGPEHDPNQCPHCARLRHPSQRHTRAALARIPRQRRRTAKGGERA
ncbi:hypothetical protein ABZ820_12875 [Streptomyces diacarni]|uniref:hypothetical protein n=1 Tax=Streptomyces diacarni TaxID=2800381 RepID=UPI0033EBEC89